MILIPPCRKYNSVFRQSFGWNIVWKLWKYIEKGNGLLFEVTDDGATSRWTLQERGIRWISSITMNKEVERRKYRQKIDDWESREIERSDDYCHAIIIAKSSTIYK